MDGKRVRTKALIARCLPLASLLLACAPTVAPVRPPPPVTPAPLAASAAWELEATPVVLPGRYRAKQGQDVKGGASPWAQEAAEVLGVDLPSLATSVGAGSLSAGTSHMLLVSPAHQTGDWTYCSSDAARVYQLLPVRTAAPAGEWVAVLTAAGPPEAQLVSASWRVSLAGRGSGPIATLALDAQLPIRTEGLWDVITTSLAVTGGKLAVMVEYGHAGGGDACEERFDFVVRAEAGPRLMLERRAYHEAPCGVLGRPPERGEDDDKNGT